MVPGMGRVFRGDHPVPPASASPPGGVPGGHKPVRARLPPYAWVAFDAEFRTPWRSIAICAALLMPPPSPRRRSGGWRERPPRGPPSPRRIAHASDWFGATRRPLPGLQRRSCTQGACRYEHRCTRCGGTHPAVSCPPSGEAGQPRFASWRGGGASLQVARASQAACARDLDAFHDLCCDLGVPPRAGEAGLPDAVPLVPGHHPWTRRFRR